MAGYTYNDKKEKWAKSAIQDLRYASPKNLERDFKMFKDRGLTVEIYTTDIEKLKKFKEIIDRNGITLAGRAAEVYETMVKLDIFSELG